MEGTDLCAICLDPLEAAPTAESMAMPGCGHRFHVKCVLNYAQYDIRCPMCRGVGEGVNPRPARQPTAVTLAVNWNNVEVIDLEHNEEESTEATDPLPPARVLWRRYLDRRRRAIRRCPRLSQQHLALKEVQALMQREHRAASRAYEQRCREVWRSDPEVRPHRDAFARLRRRERRLETQIDTAVEAAVGPPPEFESEDEDSNLFWALEELEV